MLKRFFLLLLLTTASAGAQIGTPGMSQSIKNMLKQMGTPAPAPAGNPTPAPATAGKAVSLDFKPSAQSRQQTIKTFVDGFRGPAPQVANELEASFKKMDVFAEIDKQTRKMFGVGVNNLADVMAVYFTYAWLVSRGDAGDPTKVQVQAVSKQFKGIATNIASMTELQKQQTADAFTLQTMFIGMITEAYNSEPAQLKEFGQGLNESLKNSGFDLNALKLTDQGFAPIK